MKRTLATAAILAAALGSSTALASADAATHQAGPSTRSGAFKVTANVNKTELLVGHKVTIKGSVRPGAAGDPVTLQVKYDGRKSWKTIDHGRLSSSSTYKFKDKVGSVRHRKYRVVKPAGAGRGPGSGSTALVTVFGWRDLTSIQPAILNGMGKADYVTFNGVRFPNSVRMYYNTANGASAVYNLNRGCKSFRATAGLDDGSPSGSSAVVTLTADDTLAYAGSFALTQSAQVAVPLTNVFRITIATANNGGGIGAMGTPQVLCSF